MTYFLHCDEPHWVETVWDSSMETNDREITDIMDDQISYYWITSDEREEVLKVMDFVQGEEVVKALAEGDLEDFEDAVENYEYTEIRDERPPQ